MSETSHGPGWWQAADGKWYSPDQPPAPGWWRASDGNWYPPSGEASAPSVESSAAVDPPTPTSEPGTTEPAPSMPSVGPSTAAPTTGTAPATAVAPAAPPSATKDRSGKGPLLVIGAVVVVLILVAGGVFVARRGSSGGRVESGGAAAGGGSSGGGGSGGGSNGGEASAAAAPDELPRNDIKLQDDVVVVRGNGGKTIKTFSDDGKTISLDPGAEGIDKLTQGKVLLLTGVTAVRVKTLEKNGDAVVITTEPATLPEVVKDGDLSWDNKVDPNAGKFHAIQGGTSASGGGSKGGTGTGGGTGGGGGSGSGGGSTGGTEEDQPDINGPLGGRTRLPTPTLVPTAYTPTAQPASMDLAAVPSKTINGKVGPLDAEISYDPDGNGAHLHVKLTSSAEVSGTIDIDVKIRNLANRGHARVENGTTQELNFTMDDLSGFAVVETKLTAAENTANIKVPPFFKLPFSVDFPAPVGGIPFTLSLSGSIQVDLALAVANASLSGRAEISFSGDAGFDFRGGNLALNGTRVQNADDLLKTVQGLASGPVGIVVTTELPKVGFGFSFLQTGAEIYISNGMVVSQTILPAPAQCTALNVAYVLAGGVEAKFLGKGFDIARKPFVQKEFNYQAPKDKRCNAKR